MADHDEHYTLVQFKLHPHPGFRRRRNSASHRGSPAHSQRESSVEQDQVDSCTINLCCHNTFWSDPLPDLTIHLHSSTTICCETGLLISDLPPPSPPNHLITCGDITLWLPDDEEQQKEQHLVLPQPSPLPKPRVGHWHFLAITACVAGALIIYLAGIALHDICESKPDRVETIYVQPPFATDVLPIFEEYSHILFEQIPLPESLVPNTELCLNDVSKICGEIKNSGGFYNDINGFRFPSWEYYLQPHEYAIPPGTTDIRVLCRDITERKLDVKFQWKKTLSHILSMFSRYSMKIYNALFRDLMTKFPDPRSSDVLTVVWLEGFLYIVGALGLRVSFVDGMKYANDLEKTVSALLQDVDLLKHIALQVKPSPSTGGWFSSHKSTTLDLSRLIYLQRNLTSLHQHITAYLDAQNAILDQEKLFAEWLTSLLSWESTHPSPYSLPTDDIHSNPWAVWRPRSENGSFCLVPRCPAPKADGDNVLVKLTLPTAGHAFGLMYWVMEYSFRTN